MKDYFSERSHDYARYRPTYPQSVFNWIRELHGAKERAWDCATGNGQFASGLVSVFKEVYASDLSNNQLQHALHPNQIHYSQQRAEATNYPDDYFDFVSVAQAIHWFDFDAFYTELKRVLHPNGLFFVCGYAQIQTFPEADEVIDYLYRDILDAYWFPERRYVDEGYQTIPFPFEELPTPTAAFEAQWSINELLGYLSTWSARTNYMREKQQDPLDLIREKLTDKWGEHEQHPIRFPLLMRLGNFIS